MPARNGVKRKFAAGNGRESYHTRQKCPAMQNSDLRFVWHARSWGHRTMSVTPLLLSPPELGNVILNTPRERESLSKEARSVARGRRSVMQSGSQTRSCDN